MTTTTLYSITIYYFTYSHLDKSRHIRQDRISLESIRQEMRFERLNIEKKPEKKMKKVKRTAQQRNSKVCA